LAFLMEDDSSKFLFSSLSAMISAAKDRWNKI
jgi:hypothetical protein